MAAHKYWRCYTSTNYGGAATTIDECYMFAPTGERAAFTGNGTASASSNTATAYFAFDGIAGSNQWQSAGADLPNWLKWTFPTPVDIGTVGIRNNGDPTYSAKDVSFQWSDDNVTWTTHLSFVNPTTSPLITYAAPPGTATAALTVGSFTASGYGGANATLYQRFSVVGYMGGSAALTAPSAFVTAGGGITGALTAPLAKAGGFFGIAGAITTSSWTVSGSISQSANVGALVMPSAVVAGAFGINAALTLGACSVAATGTSTGLLTAALVAPSFFVAGSATVGSISTGALTIGASAALGYLGINGALTIGPASVSATGTAGGLIIASITAPAIIASGSISQPGHLNAALTMPMLRPGATLRAALSFSSPRVAGTVVATVVLTAADYEAYAVNLVHQNVGSAQNPPVDEVTHYAKYPFTQILRFGSRYVGIGPFGLFDLSGPDDDGVPIPWVWQTAKTDDKTMQKKRIKAAYFGGRMGAAATITIVSGEAGPGQVAYNYTTPRDATAQNYRQKFGMGLMARWYGIGAAAPTAGAELALESITFDSEKLTRSI